MATFRGVDIETPQETQRRRRAEQMKTFSQMSSPTQQFGAQLALTLGNLFGLGKGEEKRSEERWEALKGISHEAEVNMVHKQLDAAGASQRAQIADTMQAQGASPEQIAQAVQQHEQAISQQKAQLAQQTAQDELQRSKQHFIKQGADPLESEVNALANGAVRLRELGGAENRAMADQMISRATELMVLQRDRAQKADTLKAQKKEAEVKTRVAERQEFEALDVSDLNAEIVRNEERLKDVQYVQSKAGKALQRRTQMLRDRKYELEQAKKDYQVVEQKTTLEDGTPVIQTIAVDRNNPSDVKTIGRPIPLRDTKSGGTTADRKLSQENAAALANLSAIEGKLSRMNELDNPDLAEGPIAGLIPGVIAGESDREYGSLEDELSTMLKPLVKAPGEGTFTDADQARLDSLVPKRTDDPATRLRKYRDIHKLLAERGQAISPDYVPQYEPYDNFNPKPAQAPTPADQPRSVPGQVISIKPIGGA